MLQDLVIFQKVYDLILWMYPTVNKFPKSQRFVLGQRIENTILKLLEGIIKANQEILNSSYDKKIGVGIPIGNLTSQLFANIYLNELDQFVKHNLKIKHYIRYMDDLLFLNDNKKKLREIKKQVQEFLKDKLKLELHPKKANVFPINGGIDFLGYRIYGSYRLLRKSTVKRFIKRTKIYQEKLKNDLISEEKFNQSLQSWLAYAKFAHSWQLRKSLSKKLKVKLII